MVVVVGVGALFMVNDTVAVVSVYDYGDFFVKDSTYVVVVICVSGFSSGEISVIRT